MDTIKPSDFGVGVMHNLAIAAAKVGITPTDLDRLWRNKKQMLQLAHMLHGDEVDCAGKPFIPDNWEYKDEDQIASAYRGKLNASKISLFLHDNQKIGVIKGSDLKLALEGKAVLTAHVLDFLFRPENQHLIPEEWKKQYTYFWGSIYRDSGGGLCVRYLYWDGGRWRWSGYWLGGGWDASYPAAILASCVL